tara:strand:+ start:286 stop:681 length:396 start_codon:yes stop_codon:yes gene_type:complete
MGIMNENELHELVKKNSSNFRMLVGDESFNINEIDIFKTDNPISEPTTRGGVYFAELKEIKIQATIQDTTISKYLSKAMLGPNKDFLDIILESYMQDGRKISLIVNLTNSMQNTTKVVLYLTLKDAIIESQ